MTTKIEQACAFIAKQTSARTPEIAEHLGVESKSIVPLLYPVVDRGYLVSCKVSGPSGRDITEYKLSSSVAPGTTWDDFRRAHPAPTIRPLASAKPRPPRTPEGSGDQSPVKVVPHQYEIPKDAVKPVAPVHTPVHDTVSNGLIAAEMAKQKPMLAPIDLAGERGSEITEALIRKNVGAKAAAEHRLVFLIGTDGRLRIEFDGQLITASVEETRALGELMADTESAWE